MSLAQESKALRQSLNCFREDRDFFPLNKIRHRGSNRLLFWRFPPNLEGHFLSKINPDLSNKNCKIVNVYDLLDLRSVHKKQPN